MTLLTFEDLYTSNQSHGNILLPLAQATADHITTRATNPTYYKSLKFTQSDLEGESPWRAMRVWEHFLLAALMSSGEELTQIHRDLNCNPLWKHLQVIKALESLAAYFLGEDIAAPKIQQLPSGAAPLHWETFWPWANIPHHSSHALLGALWAILGKIHESNEHILAAERLAEWQLSTLSVDFAPLESLFSEEGSASYLEILSHSYLLYHTLARITQSPRWEYVAQRLLGHIQDELEREKQILPALPFALLQWLKQETSAITPRKFSLDTMVCDPHTSLLGYRSERCHVTCTLNGGNTGMGAFYQANLGFVNFGPQLQEPGKPPSFGFNKGCSANQTQPPHICIDGKAETFRLKNTVRLTTALSHKESQTLYHHRDFPDTWLECSLNFSPYRLNIEVLPLTLNKEAHISFAFYLKATTCELEEDRVFSATTMKQYDGDCRRLYSKNETHCLSIEAHEGAHNMQVTALPSKQWGADFLLVYKLNSYCQKAAWTLEFSPLS